MTSARSYALGVVFIVAVAGIWAGASVLVQHVFSSLDFSSPFLLTFACNSLFIVLFPVFFVSARLGLSRRPCDHESDALYNSAPQRSDAFEEDGTLHNASVPKPLRPMLSHRDTAKVGLLMMPLWFAANWGYNASLLLTSVTSSTILSSTSSLFTLLFAWRFAGEIVTRIKTAGVVLCVLGSVCVALGDRDGSGGGSGGSETDLIVAAAALEAAAAVDEGPLHSVWGDLVCLLAAAAYGAYTTVLRASIPADRDVAMSLVFAYLGLGLAIALAPAAATILLLSPHLRAALTWEAAGLIVVKGLADNVLSDYLWGRAVLLTSPVVATVGLALTIPVAFATDALLHGARPNGWQLLGALAVIAGFLAVNVDGCGGCTAAAFGKLRRRSGGGASLRYRGLRRESDHAKDLSSSSSGSAQREAE